ncbi:MAG: hypothetical protein ACRDU9_07465 [Acidimicrobiia bacterium]
MSDGVEGQASNCEFGVDGGVTDVVHVYYYGTDEGWDGTRQGFEDNRGGVTDISGIGDEAFHPNDTGPGALIVRAGGHIFSVGVISLFEEPGAEVVDAVGNLAAAIAADLG